MDRRAFVAGTAAAVAAWQSGLHAQGIDQPAHVETTMREVVIQKARDLAARPYRHAPLPLPKELGDLGYDAYRRIDNRHNLNLWRDGPGGVEAQPLLRGFIYHDQMRLHLIEDGAVRDLSWDAGLFDFKDVPPPQTDADIGYSGVRLLAPIDDPKVAVEFLVFQGASYFRALATGLTYGLSARGLAVRTADPRGEEFPAFTDLWIEKPVPGQDVVIHALLDGPSASGAFMFTIRPSSKEQPETRIGVNAALFARTDLDNIGLAPLTSMYWYGPLERGGWDDYRPQVHDSDGLTICDTDGEWLWRPLANPRQLQISAFDAGPAPLGFGLAQRSRDWRNFQDSDAKYERRPGAWIAPHADWPAGKVVLVEIPTENEYNDNIVAYWRPAKTIPKGSRLDFGYDLIFRGEITSGYGLLETAASRSGAYARTWRQIVIDFAHPGTERINPHRLTPEVTATGGRIEAVTLSANQNDGSLRLTFMLVPESAVCELRAVIGEAGRPVSETWLYRWTGP